MSVRKISSIKEYIIMYSVIIFIVVFFAASLHYFVYGRHLQSLQVKQQTLNLKYSADNVSRLIAFYQNIVDKIAQQHRIVDLINFGDKKQIQNWSAEMQRLLSQSIGFALFDNSGKVIGETSLLRLSDRCLIDMHRRINGLDINLPPVHSKIKDLAHFDIISPVLENGHTIGLVFASFSLSTLNDLLADMQDEGFAYELITTDDLLITRSDNLLDVPHNDYQMEIPETSWIIKKQFLKSDNNSLITGLLFTNIITFLLLSGVLFIAIKRLFNIIVSDFEKLSWMMHEIKQGKFDPANSPEPHLSETEGIVRFILYTAEELNSHQSQLKQESTTDELTGLFNRRILNEKIDDYLLQYSTQNQVFVCILDMDHFKTINDTFGHEVGDKILQIFSSVLVNCSKESDICTRAGGDEFIVILVDYTTDGIKQWYKNLCYEMKSGVDKINSELDIQIQYGISAGCTELVKDDIKSELLNRADKVLYQVKMQGRNQLLFSHAEVQ